MFVAIRYSITYGGTPLHEMLVCGRNSGRQGALGIWKAILLLEIHVVEERRCITIDSDHHMLLTILTQINNL